MLGACQVGQTLNIPNKVGTASNNAGTFRPQGYAAALNQGVAPGQGNGQETRINRYDADGRLLHQKVLKSDNTAQADISWDPAETLGASTPAGYDAVGDVRGGVPCLTSGATVGVRGAQSPRVR